MIQPGAPPPADGHATPVAQHRLHAPRSLLHFTNPIELYDSRSVYPEKPVRVQARFQRTQRLAQEIALAPDVNLNIVIVGRNPVDLRDRDYNIVP